MLTVEQAHAMGKKGSPYSEHERLLYEAYCKGHCWAVGQWLEGKGIYEDITDRIRFAMWRDRGALEAAATADARATIQQLVDALGWLHLGEGPETRVGPALEAGRAWLAEAQKGDGHHGT